MVPSYDNLFMGLLDTKYVDSTPLQPFTWLRYIDDIFLIWTHRQESLETFLHKLNCAFPFKFNWSFTRKHTTFLDVDVWLRNSKPETGVHIKPTNTIR